MKTQKVIMVMTAMMLSASPIYADSITDGIGSAGDAVYSYTPIIQALGYALAAIVGLLAQVLWLVVTDGGKLTQLFLVYPILSGFQMTAT